MRRLIAPLILVGAALQAAEPVAPASANTAIVPVPKLENDSYDWYARHDQVLTTKRGLDPEIVLIGDSITHFWGGNPGGQQNGPASWQSLFGDRRVLNLGFGWDRTQNVLWRLEHGEFDGLAPRRVVIAIGTNNLTGTANARENTPEEIVAGIAAVCARIHAMSPKSRIIHMAVFPRGWKADDPFRPRIAAVNRLLAAHAAEAGHRFIDIGPKLLQADGSISPEIMGDACHPTDKGYAVWADALRAEFAATP